MNLVEAGHQKILITGVTGTLGRAVCKRLLEDCGKYVSILGISRDEQKQRSMPKDARLTLRLGDVSDYQSMVDAIDIWDGAHFNQIYHFAALKCVDTLEDQVPQVIRTNILGTQNVVRLAKECFSRLILASTDKAVYPINAYGCSKALAEKLVLRASPENSVVRYGNVLGSRGSFLETLKTQLLGPRKVTVTDHAMTRFWWTIQEARDFVIACGYGEKHGLNYPNWIRSAPIFDFIEATAEVLGVNIYEIESPTGPRPGEKFHECMATEYETGTKTAMGKAIHSCDEDRIMRSRELRHLIEKSLKVESDI